MPRRCCRARASRCCARGRAGGDAWDVHAPGSRAAASRRQARESALRRALAREELELRWQPVVECDTGAIAGMHARLVVVGARSPGDAGPIALADEGALAVPLGQWALRATCRQGSRWLAAGHRGPRVLGRRVAASARPCRVRQAGARRARGERPAARGARARGVGGRAGPQPRGGARATRGAAAPGRAHRARPLRHGREPPRARPPLPARHAEDRRLGREGRGRQPPAGGRDRRRGRDRPLAPAAGGRRGRRQRGAARAARPLPVRADAGRALRTSHERRRRRAAARAPATGSRRRAHTLGHERRDRSARPTAGSSRTSTTAVSSGASRSPSCRSGSAAGTGSSWCCRRTRSRRPTPSCTGAAPACACGTSAARTAPS